MKKIIMICLGSFLALSGCNQDISPRNLRLTDLPVSQLRAMQSRQFVQSDSVIALRGIIKTLSSLDFLIVRVDDQTGLVEAIRLERGSIMQANVTLQGLTGQTCLIRIILRYNQDLVVNEQIYQGFFDTLSHNLSPG